MQPRERYAYVFGCLVIGSCDQYRVFCRVSVLVTSIESSPNFRSSQDPRSQVARREMMLDAISFMLVSGWKRG